MAQRSDLPDGTLADLLDARGPLDHAVEVRHEEILRYENLMPPILLDIWEAHGVGDLAGGRLRLCVPAELTDPVQALFRGDPEFSLEDGRIDAHAVAHTAFGDLFLWSERHWLVHLNVVQGLVEAPFLHRPTLRLHADTTARDMLFMAPSDLLDMHDTEDQPMFERAQAAFDPLPRMIIYAPGPAEAADPFPSFDDLYAAHYPEWLLARVTSKVWYLSDLQGGRPNIRRIGRVQR